jgi:hypothetical protein
MLPKHIIRKKRLEKACQFFLVKVKEKNYIYKYGNSIV